MIGMWSLNEPTNLIKYYKNSASLVCITHIELLYSEKDSDDK